MASTSDSRDWLTREDFGDVTVVRLHLARIDPEDTPTLFEQITSFVDDQGRQNIVLNLKPVEYLASMALGKLVTLNRKAHEASGRLALCEVSDATHEIFSATRLNQLFHIYGTEQDAVASFAVGPTG
jgi:anti-sigma B factor antagonist